MANDKWHYGDNWHIRTRTGRTLNLNTEEGARYVLELQRELEELERRDKGRRRKGGPSENKRGA